MADYFIDDHDFNGVPAVACLAWDCWSVHEIFANDGDCCIDRIFVNGTGVYSCIGWIDWQKSYRRFGGGGNCTKVLSAGAKICSTSSCFGHDNGG